MNNIKPIPPFKGWVIQNFPFIEADFDAITNYQLYCKVVEYLNKVIANENELTTAMNYVLNYFNNLDVQDEINNKLDEMAESGQLAEIINQEIFNKLNNKIEILEKTKINDKLFIATFFDGETEKIKFSTSKDGVNFSDILTNIDLSGRDPQITYNKNNKKFYICVTGGNEYNDFTMYVSDDLINWETKYVNLGILTNIRWAPELFYDDNGDIYCFISVGVDTSHMQIYKSKCIDIETLSFSPASPVSLDETNMIDASVIKYNGNYYMCVKNNTTAKELIYTSNDLINWTNINRDILKTGEKCEGGMLVVVEDKVNFYGDTWNSFNYYIMGQTTDLTNFNVFKRPESLINKRHGSITYIDDKECINLITSLESYTENLRLNKPITREFQLNGTIDELIIYPNFIYKITANTTINKLINSFDLDEFNFYFAMNNYGTLTISKIINSELQEKTINKTIYNNIYNNEKLNKITLIGNPVVMDNLEIIDIPTSNIVVSDGWTFNIYAFKIIGNKIHLDGDLQKTNAGASNVAFTINGFTPTYHNFTASNKNNICHLYTNGNFELQGDVPLNTYIYISFDYLKLR